MGIEVTDSMNQLAKAMQDAWITFAVYGKPDTPEATWPGYEPSSRATLIFDHHIALIKDPDSAKRVQLGIN